jgi:preprotein translocase subunit SecF
VCNGGEGKKNLLFFSSFRHNVLEFFGEMRFNIIENRRKWFVLSGFFVASSFLFILFFGLNTGIDFTGGTQMEIAFERAVPEKGEFSSFFSDVTGGEKGEKIVSTLDKKGYVVRSRSFSEEEVLVFSAALDGTEWGAKINRVHTIGPTVGSVFQQKAVKAVFFAIIAIVLFVAFAFRRVPIGLSSWKFGMVAIVALAHDVFIIVGLFALLGHFLGVEIDTLFITALLTVLGFSVNDTIVIFDRIRENLKGKKSMKHFIEFSEEALWQSMRRSINTSLSTLLVIGTILFFFTGFPTLFAFFLALAFGIIVGTYSSLFLAAPLLIAWHQKK